MPNDKAKSCQMAKQNRAKWQSKIVPNGKVESCQMANLDLLTQTLLIDLQHIKIFKKNGIYPMTIS